MRLFDTREEALEYAESINTPGGDVVETERGCRVIVVEFRGGVPWPSMTPYARDLPPQRGDAVWEDYRPTPTYLPPTLDKADLILFWNNLAAAGPCASCGIRWKPTTGWEVMTVELTAVCPDCTRELAPGLMAAREVAWQALEGFDWEQANVPEWVGDVILGWNEPTACGPCALCGARVESVAGWEAMTRERSPVCTTCARDLASARDAANR
jgi:hypothetical protein